MRVFPLSSCLALIILIVAFEPARCFRFQRRGACVPSKHLTLFASQNEVQNAYTPKAFASVLVGALLFGGSPLIPPASADEPSGGVVVENVEKIDRARVNQKSVAEEQLERTQPKRSIVKLPSGVQYFDVNEGTGDAAKEGSTVQFQWVLRRSNGYFVDASSNYGDEPFIYKVGNTRKVIPGLDEGIRGMKAGGVRRLNIPPEVAFVEGVGDDKPGPMPQGFGPRRQILTRIDKEVWYFEIKLTKVKNA